MAILGEAQLQGVRGEGVIARRYSHFAFCGSEEDAAPFRRALAERRRLTFRGPVIERDGSCLMRAVMVRILVIARTDTRDGYRFACTLGGS